MFVESEPTGSESGVAPSIFLTINYLVNFSITVNPASFGFYSLVDINGFESREVAARLLLAEVHFIE